MPDYSANAERHISPREILKNRFAIRRPAKDLSSLNL
jgi:hypothetical protein